MWVQIVGLVLGIIAIVVTVIISMRMRHATSKIDVSPNSPQCYNFGRTQFTEGYFLGVLKTQLPRKNGCTYIEYYPIDVEQGENKPRPPIQSMVVKNEFIKRLARGDLSSRREQIFFVSRNPADIPEKLRDTEEGKWLKKEGQKAWILSTFGESIPAGDEAIAEAMVDYARGEIPKSTLAQIKEANKKWREMQVRQPDPESGSQEKK